MTDKTLLKTNLRNRNFCSAFVAQNSDSGLLRSSGVLECDACEFGFAKKYFNDLLIFEKIFLYINNNNK